MWVGLFQVGVEGHVEWERGLYGQPRNELYVSL